MGRKFQKKKKVVVPVEIPKDENPPLPAKRLSDDPIPKKVS